MRLEKKIKNYNLLVFGNEINLNLFMIFWYLHFSFASLSPRTLNCDIPSINSLKSTSPFPSVSKRSMTRCTSGFCCRSCICINSSLLNAPEPSMSSFLKRLPSLFISSVSTFFYFYKI
jgi:hypothetical protein